MWSHITLHRKKYDRYRIRNTSQAINSEVEDEQLLKIVLSFLLVKIAECGIGQEKMSMGNTNVEHKRIG